MVGPAQVPSVAVVMVYGLVLVLASVATRFASCAVADLPAHAVPACCRRRVRVWSDHQAALRRLSLVAGTAGAALAIVGLIG